MSQGFAESGFGSIRSSGIVVSAGTTSSLLSAITFSNTNGFTFNFSGNASTIVGSVSTNYQDSTDSDGNPHITTAMPSNAMTAFKISAGAASHTGSALTFSNTNNVAFGLSGSTITALGGYLLSEWDSPLSMQRASNFSLAHNTIFIQPFDIYHYLNAYRVNFYFNISVQNQTSNDTGQAGYTFSYCIYTKDAGNTTRLSALKSASFYYSFSVTNSTAISAIIPNGIADLTSVAYSTYAVTDATASNFPVSTMNGLHVVPMPVGMILSPGRYWMAVANSTSSANTSVALSISYAQGTSYSNSWNGFRQFGQQSVARNGSFYNCREGHGYYSVSSGAFPDTIPLTSDSIRASTSHTVIFFNISGYTTGNNWL